jgi:hypothetical protein
MDGVSLDDLPTEAKIHERTKTTSRASRINQIVRREILIVMTSLTPPFSPLLLARSTPLTKQPHRLLMRRAGQGDQAAHNERQFVDRRSVPLVDVAAQPASGKAAVTGGFLSRNERRQLQRFGEAHLADFPRRRFGDEQVAAL